MKSFLFPNYDMQIPKASLVREARYTFEESHISKVVKIIGLYF